MGARYYNPTTQTFITPDPIRFEGGMNWYQYASGNPLTNIDATGTCPTSISSNYYGSGLSGFTSSLVNGISYAMNSPSNASAINFAQNTLSGVTIAAMVTSVLCPPLAPVMAAIGAGASLVNAGISTMRNDTWGAVANLASAIPSLGILAKSVVATRGASSVVSAISKTAVPTVGNSNSMVQVTSWAPKGVVPDLNPGRWVVKGGNSFMNYLKTGLYGPQISGKILKPSTWKFSIGAQSEL